MEHPTPTAPPREPGGQAPLGVPPALDGAAAAASDAPVAPACANCGAVLVGPYCAQCGQEAVQRMVSLTSIVQDALEDQLSFNAALPRTLSALLLHPGRLTREFVAGRIRSYLPPMRVYLVSSVLFFLVMAGVPDRVAHNASLERVRVSSDTSHSIVRRSVTSTGQAAQSNGVRLDTVGAPGWLRARIRSRAQRLEGMSQRDATREILAAILGAAPKVAFVLLPLFAALLKLLYIRRRRLYIEHFVFALHTHAVAFLAFTTMALAGLVLANVKIGFDLAGWLNLVLCSWLVFYFFHALRVVYGQGWLKTFFKMGALAFVYMFVLVFAMVGAVLFAFFSF